MENTVFAGLDEAGRGSVIGPMIIAGVSLERKDEARLNALGVKDSKELSPTQRERLAKEIEKVAKDIVIVNLSACRIDNMRKGGINLNRIEAMKFADILNILTPGVAFVDCPDVNPERLTLILKKMLKAPGQLVVEHKADSRYPICSAASIIAKVTRDREVRKLHKKYGDFGPGYSSNEKTMAWLREWLETKGDYPEIVRKGWITAKELKNERAQKGLGGFFRKLVGKEEGCEPKERAEEAAGAFPE